jgi:glutathione S-transferase
MQLVIGNKNYSSWSLRPWLLLDYYLLDFEEVNVSLNAEGRAERLAKYSATKKVPVLIDKDLVVWDSIAICEYVSETYLKGEGWPSDRKDRAIARAISAEMHSGFTSLRNEMPMNCRAKRKIELSDAAKKDVKRIDEIWANFAKKDEDGKIFLFGKFSIADCFFAPVVFRFMTYGIELSEASRAYMKSMLELESMKNG